MNNTNINNIQPLRFTVPQPVAIRAPPLHNDTATGCELKFIQLFTLQSFSAVKSPVASLEVALLIISFILSHWSSR